MSARRSGQLGSVAERSKALDLGSSLFGGVGSNPTAATSEFFSRDALACTTEVDASAVIIKASNIKFYDNRCLASVSALAFFLWLANRALDPFRIHTQDV